MEQDMEQSRWEPQKDPAHGSHLMAHNRGFREQVTEWPRPLGARRTRSPGTDEGGVGAPLGDIVLKGFCLGWMGAFKVFEDV